jgi:hypothetical protein
MRRALLLGLAAGAAGTAALNIVTYLDMAGRGRPSSSVPADVAGELAGAAGVELASGQGEEAQEAAGNRREGIGALLGYVTGLGVGAAYGALRAGLERLPLPLAAAGVGAAAMAGSDVPATALGVTDPRSWPPSSWVADILPHLAYGVVTVFTYDWLDEITG